MDIFDESDHVDKLAGTDRYLFLDVMDVLESTRKFVLSRFPPVTT